MHSYKDGQPMFTTDDVLAQTTYAAELQASALMQQAAATGAMTGGVDGAAGDAAQPVLDPNAGAGAILDPTAIDMNQILQNLQNQMQPAANDDDHDGTNN